MNRKRKAMMAALTALATGLTAGAANYNDAAAGNWSDASTWGGAGYPASTADNATMDSHAVTLDVNPTIGSLTINEAAASLDTSGHTLTLSGGFTFSRGSTLGNGRIVVTNSSLTMSTQDYGPTNATTIDLHSGGTYASTAGGRILSNYGTINLKGGRFTQSGRNIAGTGTWNIFPGTAYTNFAQSTYAANANFINNHGAMHTTPDPMSIGSGAHSGRFTGIGYTFLGTHTFQNGSSIQTDAGGSISIDTATWEAGSSLITSNLTIRNSGMLASEVPLSVQSFNGGSPVLVTSDVPITCSGPFTWARGTLRGSGPITAEQFLVSLPGSGSVSTNYKPIVVLNGGSFNSGQSDSIFWNLGRIELLGGEFSVISGKAHLFRGTGTLYIGPSATLHRQTQTTTLLHENVTTNAGTIKATTGTINFSGGMAQTATGALRGNGGTLEGTLTVTGGQIAPGTSAGVAGTLTLSGTVNLFAAAKIAVEIGGTTVGTQYDRLNGGTINLNGCSLEVQFIDGFHAAVQNGDTFTPVVGNLSGSFGNVAGGRVETADGKGSFAVAVTTGVGGKVILSDYQPARSKGAMMMVR